MPLLQRREKGGGRHEGADAVHPQQEGLVPALGAVRQQGLQQKTGAGAASGAPCKAEKTSSPARAGSFRYRYSSASAS